MNMRIEIFTVLVLSIVFVSCRESQTPSGRVNPFSTKTDSIFPNQDEAPIIQPDINEDYQNQIKDDIISEQSTLEASNPVKSKKFYEGLLEDFCKKYYHKKFPGRTYVYGSICVETTTQTDANTVEVKGLHSFKGRLGIRTYDNKEFRAMVRSEDNCNFHIKFDRRLVKPISGGGEWVSTGDLPFTYNRLE